MKIETRTESRRGCGWRKPGGLYLVSDGPGLPCGKLPIPLTVCPTCSSGVKPSRGWMWINGTALAAEKGCSSRNCVICPLSKPMGRVGLIWIGGAFYETPAEFEREAERLGISRRISAVPRGFQIGKTWVWLAHRKVISNTDGTWTPGVFRIFKPQRIEYVVKGTESAEELAQLAERGLTLVKIERAGETSDLPLMETRR